MRGESVPRRNARASVSKVSIFFQPCPLPCGMCAVKTSMSAVGVLTATRPRVSGKLTTRDIHSEDDARLAVSDLEQPDGTACDQPPGRTLDLPQSAREVAAPGRVARALAIGWLDVAECQPHYTFRKRGFTFGIERILKSDIHRLPTLSTATYDSRRTAVVSVVPRIAPKGNLADSAMAMTRRFPH